jgi:hypothetical protein
MKSRSLIILAVVTAAVATTLVLLLNRQPEVITTVYSNDFPPTVAVGPEWSETRIGKTPKGARPYLGGFVEKPVELSLKDLPKHKLLRLTFDLYLMRCWDGSSKTFGAKLWNLDVVNAQNLIHTTFSTAGFFSDNNEQAFPDTYPCRPVPAWTGAAEKQTLGVMQSWGGPDRTFDTSAVYHFVLTFPHIDEKVTFRFSSIMEKSKDKSYGLTNVKVETIPACTKPSEEELGKLWQTLGDNDSEKAYAAQWQLVTAADRATDYIAAHLQEPCDASPEQIGKWIEELNTAEKASTPITGLVVQGRNSAKAIAEARSRSSGLTATGRSRLDYISKIITPYPETLTELRNHRARQLLQIIHSQKSLALAATIPAHEAPKRDVE